MLLLSSEFVLALLATYAIHSTLLLGGVWILVSLSSRVGAELREFLWKGALVGGVLTSVCQVAMPGTPWMGSLSLPTATPHQGSLGALNQSDLAADHRDSTERLNSQETSASKASQPAIHAESPSAATNVVWWRFASHSSLPAFLLVGWLTISGILIARLVWRVRRLRTLSVLGLPNAESLALLAQVKDRLHIPFRVRLLETELDEGPMAAGLFARRLYCPAAWLKSLRRAELEAIFAHELAHLARHDAWWNLASEFCCAVFFFQPLNYLARRQIREQAEFLADQQAAEALADGLSLARCLVYLAESREFPARDSRWQTAVAVGMSAYRSQLGRRVERLCSPSRPPSLSRRGRWSVVAMLTVVLSLIPVLAPGAVARRQDQPPGESPLKTRSLSTTAALAAALGLAAQVPAEETTPNQVIAATVVAQATDAPRKDEPGQQLTAEERTKFPDGARGVSGQLIGRLVSKDAEKGELTLEKVRLNRVWKGSKASAPKSLDGRTVRIEKVFGKFLDVLLSLKAGDGVQIEVKHVSGDNLVFLGEELKKIALDDQPREDNAKRPDAPKKVDEPKKTDEPRKTEEPKKTEDTVDGPPGLAGFRGILTGEVVSTDSEQGVLVFKMASVKRTWPQNKAPAPDKSKGKSLRIEGISGKWLDVLLSFKPGDKIEVEAFHVRGENLRFPGEWLKKLDVEGAK